MKPISLLRTRSTLSLNTVPVQINPGSFTPPYYLSSFAPASFTAATTVMLMPGLLDRLLARKSYEGQITSEIEDPPSADNLFQPVPGGHATHGRFDARAQVSTPAFNAALVRTVLATSVIAVVAALASATTFVLTDRSR